jgi:hypothetical protein
MRRIAYLRWLAPVLAAFLVAGCGVLTATKLKPKAKTLTHAAFVQRANRACVRFEHGLQGVHLKASRNFQKIDTLERTIVIPAYERLLFVLRGLAPPPADVVDYRRMLATFNYLDLNLHQLLDAADAALANRDVAQLHRMRTISRRFDRLNKRLSARAKKLGLRRCD